jgi:16S rRNA (uracil1498-N3)-methyltransferase
MNLILLFSDDFVSPQRVILRDRRKAHIETIHRAQAGDKLRIGQLNGLIGTGHVIHLDDQELELDVTFHESPPTPLSLTLLLALPRPKMLKRILQTVSSMGVKNIHLINSYRVDKSFWGSPLLQTEKLQEQLILGLEQARDTIMPTVHLHQRFKPFVEDDLPRISEGTKAFVAHPGVTHACPSEIDQEITLAIGPEGGFIPYEVDKLAECGFLPINLGERILRVETAVPVLLSRLTPLQIVKRT